MGALHHGNYRGFVQLVTLRTPVKWSDTSVKSPSAVVLHMSTPGMPLVHSNHLLKVLKINLMALSFIVWKDSGSLLPKTFTAHLTRHFVFFFSRTVTVLDHAAPPYLIMRI